MCTGINAARSCIPFISSFQFGSALVRLQIGDSISNNMSRATADHKRVDALKNKCYGGYGHKDTRMEKRIDEPRALQEWEEFFESPQARGIRTTSERRAGERRNLGCEGMLRTALPTTVPKPTADSWDQRMMRASTTVRRDKVLGQM